MWLFRYCQPDNHTDGVEVEVGEGVGVVVGFAEGVTVGVGEVWVWVWVFQKVFPSEVRVAIWWFWGIVWFRWIVVSPSIVHVRGWLRLWLVSVLVVGLRVSMETMVLGVEPSFLIFIVKVWFS